MKRDVLQDLYGRIYDFTDVAGDSALELMDDFIESEGLTLVFGRFLDEAELSEDEIDQLSQCFEEILGECEDEFGDCYYEDED